MTQSRNGIRDLSIVSVLAGTTMLTTPMLLPAAAQEEAAPRGYMVEEIVVSARKRSESLQDVPLSIGAITGDQARNLGANDIVDLSRNVAGLTIADLGPGQSQVAIRGVSSGQVVRDESSRKETVGIYLDESVISVALFTPDIDLFDLERVEVLRGPQGTLFGSGSLGGTIRYITRQPVIDELEGSAEATISTIEHGNEEGSIKGAINVPIVEGKVAARAVAYYNRIGGFINAIDHDGSITKDVDDGDKYGGRLAILFEPTERLRITPRIVYQKLETNGFPRADVWNLFLNPFTTTRPAGTFGDYEQFRQTDEGLDDDFLLLDGTIEYDFDGATLTSVSSYTDREVDVLRDSAQLTGQITGVLIGLPDLATLDAPLLDATTLEVFTQELRIASSDEGPFQWLFGGYYFTMDKTYGQTLDVAGFTDAFNAATGAGLTGAASNPLSNNPDNLFISDFDIDLRQYSLFGEASYDITDRLTATAGLRWYDFKEDRVAIITGFFNCGADLVNCSTPEAQRNRTTEGDGFNPRFILSYDVSDEVTVNAQAAKGFRLGGINDPLIAGICEADAAALGGVDIERFDDESVWNYEVGFKSQLAGGKVVFNASAYYVDIKGLQVSVRLPCSSTIILNVPKARSIGAEAELFVMPNENLSFGIVANYNDAEVREGVDLVNIQEGDRLPTSPKFQLSANATYTQPVSDQLDGFVTVAFQHVGNSISFLLDQRNDFTLPFNINFGRNDPLAVAFPTKLDSYNIVNLRAGVKKLDTWEVALFVNNLLDETAELALDRERGGEGRVSYLRNQPRTFGLTVRTEF
ncbi:MAG: TonB-dependent receptor [Alphaproteobacteria bacterium]|nr:MAG: TonB-dependent receptor [Alphaproteobacteria bacterium]